MVSMISGFTQLDDDSRQRVEQEALKALSKSIDVHGSMESVPANDEFYSEAWGLLFGAVLFAGVPSPSVVTHEWMLRLRRKAPFNYTSEN